MAHCDLPNGLPTISQIVILLTPLILFRSPYYFVHLITPSVALMDLFFSDIFTIISVIYKKGLYRFQWDADIIQGCPMRKRYGKVVT